MEKNIKYTSPETRKAMIDYATENLVGTFSRLPGGSGMSEKQYEKFKEQCKDTLEETKTFEEMQQVINGIIQKIEVLVENADVKMGHWRETEQEIEKLRHEFDERFSAIKELEDQRDVRIQNIVQGFKDKLEGKEEEVNPFEEEPFLEIETSSIEQLENFENDEILEANPFEESVQEESSLDEEKSEKEKAKIIERDGQKYIVTKDAVYDEQNQLVEPGELRTIGAAEKENMEQGHVVINKGTYNMVLTLDEYAEFIKTKDRTRDTEHKKDTEINM